MLFLREWYMHPNGQIARLRVRLRRRQSAGACLGLLARLQDDRRPRAARDRLFLSPLLSEAADQLHLVGQSQGPRRPKPVRRRLPRARQHRRVRSLQTAARRAAHLEQADGTAWMAFFCATMLSMALELARDNPAYEDMASKFFEHFVAITDAMNTLGGTGLWDEEDGFYYDQLRVDGRTIPLKIRSLVGLIPLLAVEVLDDDAHRGAARLQEAAGLVSRAPSGPEPAHLLLLPPGRRRGALPPLAGHPVARAAGAGAALHARRKGIPLAVRHPVPVALSPGPAVYASG